MSLKLERARHKASTKHNTKRNIKRVWGLWLCRDFTKDMPKDL
ncbi:MULTISPECIES: hypothetical protein [unclassified Helicobacter]|nr:MULTISPECIES: hypothetical protein [unclassified Helicobacter]